MREVQEILEQRRRQNEIDLENRKSHVYNLLPRIKEIEKNIKKLNIEAIGLSLESNNIDNHLKEISELSKEKEKILLDNNISPDYLKMKYHCNICKDTGVDVDKICKCKKQLLTQKMYEDSGIQEIIQEENFNNFNLNLFRKNRQSNEPISPYENMKELSGQLYQYSINFDSDSVNLYIYGNVGTGKTYLLNSITKEVLDRGYTVVYLTESELVNIILEHRFAFSEHKEKLNDKIESIFTSDLLIIDDLGTNNTNDTTTSALFEVLNDRLVKKRAVIISSNYDPESLREIYDLRIYSRILGKYYAKQTFGNDVRMQL